MNSVVTRIRKLTLQILTILNYGTKEGEILIWNGTDISIVDKVIKNLEMFIGLIESKMNNRKFMEVAEKDPEKMAYVEECRKKELAKKAEEKIMKDKLLIHAEDAKNNWKKNQDSKGKNIEFGSEECAFKPAENKGG